MITEIARAHGDTNDLGKAQRRRPEMMHLRQHERFSANDKPIQARVDALHRGPPPPRHLVSPP
jgi:hypothetical protein